MARCWSYPSPISLLQPKKGSSFPIPFIPKSLTPTIIYPNTSLSLSSNSISTSHNLCFSSFASICCSTSSESSTASDHSHSTSVFIKGLPQSTSEGRLKKAFSQFGEVNLVKINTDKFSGQSLGSAYVGFAREEFAHLAVKEMNGRVHLGKNCKA